MSSGTSRAILSTTAVLLLLAASACDNATPTAPPTINPPTCTGPETTCGQSCANLALDDAHCGSCEKACASGERCANGACFPSSCGPDVCRPDSVCFEGACTDKACVGVSCAKGQYCSGGLCVCDPALDRCEGSCTDLKTDGANCGACGKACAANESCAAGACHPNECASEECNPLSVCLDGNCTEKACVGVACPSGLQCVSGLCTCAGGQVSCGGACVEVKTNPQHCGACGIACATGEHCAAGLCLPKQCGAISCDPGELCYLGACVETACVGVACSSGKVCSAGLCVCPDAKTDCDGECASLDQSTAHCGTCAKQCAANEGCVSGTCVMSACPFGQTPCVSGCKDVTTDAQNCGQCGDVCGAGRNCVNGTCQCPQGTTFCNGACVVLTSDPSNCGACGKTCNGGTCSGSVCSCPSGMALCNGTCIDVVNDPLNCGTCAKACAAGQACNGGICACAPGKTLCNGTCIDTSGDNLNCGTCNQVCASGKFCNKGGCVDPFTCQTNYTAPPAGCAVLPLAATNCGAATALPSLSFSGSVVLNQDGLHPFTIGPSERITLSGNLTSTNNNGQNVRVSMRNLNLQQLLNNYFTVNGATPAFTSLTTTGSSHACSHPIEALVRPEFGSGTVTYNLTLARSALDRYNLGGTTIGTATSLAINPTTMRVCDQVCGDTKRFCGLEPQYFKVTVPPKKAMAMEIYAISNASSGTNFAFQAFRPSGALICDVATNKATTSTSPSLSMGRIVNNTDLPQDVILTVSAGFGAGMVWHIAVAEEP